LYFSISVILELAINNKPIYRKSFINYTHGCHLPQCSFKFIDANSGSGETVAVGTSAFQLNFKISRSISDFFSNKEAMQGALSNKEAMQGALTGQCTPLDPHLIFLKTPCILPHYCPEVAETPESACRLN
jgi:hypothetical protein